MTLPATQHCGWKRIGFSMAVSSRLYSRQTASEDCEWKLDTWRSHAISFTPRASTQHIRTLVAPRTLNWVTTCTERNRIGCVEAVMAKLLAYDLSAFGSCWPTPCNAAQQGQASSKTAKAGICDQYARNTTRGAHLSCSPVNVAPVSPNLGTTRKDR